MNFSSILICKQTVEDVDDYCCFYINMTKKGKSKKFLYQMTQEIGNWTIPSFEIVALQVKLLQAKQIGFLHNCAIAF